MTQINTEQAAAIVRPEEQKGIHAFGDEVILHLTGAETGGQTTLFTGITPPGGGPPPHYHLNEDEWFLILEGRADFFLDGVWQEMPVGTSLYVPKGVIHTFRNAGDTPLKMLTQTSPSGFEHFMEDCAAEFAKPGPPDMGRIVEISAEYGIHFVN